MAESLSPGAPVARTDPELAFIERLGLAVLRRTPAYPAVAGEDDPIHIINADERRAIQRIERGAVLRAMIAGALSGSASASTAMWAHRAFIRHGHAASSADAARFWLIVGSTTVIASVFEIGFLYWDALRTVHRMASAAGLKLSERELSAEQREIALALARAALEVPNPPHPFEGVNPHRERVRALIVVSSLLYKGKVALTNLLVKGALRSFIGRSLARRALELTTVPVTALWNAVVCWLVVREARIRAMGPSAALELVGQALRDLEPSREGREAALRAVASAIVRTRDLHPNHVAVFRAFAARGDAIRPDELDDPQRFVARLSRLSPVDQCLALRLLVIAAILDGRLTRAERRLLEDAFAACGRSLELRHVEQLRRAFVAGRELRFELVRAITDGAAQS